MNARSTVIRRLLLPVGAAALWCLLAIAVPAEHDASDGIVGTPAFRNYSERREKYLYLAAHVLAVAYGASTCLRRRTGPLGSSRAAPAGGALEISESAPQRGTISTTVLICAAIYGLFVWVAQYDAPFDGFHEGARLNYTQASLDGKVPYRDFDCVYGLWYGVLQHRTAFWLSGEISVRAAHRLANWLAPLLPVAMYGICWIVARNRIHALSGFGLASLLMFADPFLIYWPVDHHGFTTRHVWPALNVGLMLLYIRSRRTCWIALAGAGTGLAALWPLQSTIVPLAAIIGTLLLLPLTDGHSLRSTARAAGWFLGGLIVGLLPLAVYLLWHDAAGAFFDYHAKVLRIHPSWNGQMFPTPGELLRRHHWTVAANGWMLMRSCAYFYLPPLLTLCSSAALGRALVQQRFTSAQAGLLCLTGAAFVNYFSAIERSDGHHAAYAALMHVPLLLALLELRRPIALRPVRVAASAGVMVLCLIVPAYSIATRVSGYAMRNRQGQALLTQQIARQWGIPHYSTRQLRTLEVVNSYLQQETQRGDGILDLSDWFAANFLFDRPAPGRFYYMYDAVSPADQRRIVARLAQTEVAIVPLETQDVASVDAIPAAARYHLVMERLLADFAPDRFLHLVDQTGRTRYTGYVLMRPRDTRAAPSPRADEAGNRLEWINVAARLLNLGMLPYFGESLFGPTDTQPRQQAQIRPIPSPKRERTFFAVGPPNRDGRERLLRLQINFAAALDSQAYIGWTVPGDPEPYKGWRIQFALSGKGAHVYIVKLASVPQWVWAGSKGQILLDLPAGAEPIGLWWE